MKRPNILLIQCDSMDGRGLGCMGHPAAHTPHLDRLAARGALFRRAYCNSPVSCPSRASMWSGQHVHRVRAWNNRKGLTEDDPTFEHDLIRAGYRTATIGRDDKYAGAHTLGCALTSWIRASGIELPRHTQRPHTKLESDGDTRIHEQDWERVDRARRWLERYGGEPPFFLHVGFNKPHPMAGYRTSPAYLGQIPRAAIPLPPADREDHPVMRYMRVLKGCDAPFTEKEILDIRQYYCAMLSEVDAMVGEVLAGLDACGLTDSTCVVFTSDHGDLQMEHSQNRKSAMYEGSVRVPLIAAGPDIAPGRGCDSLVSLVDLYPTLLDVAGLTPARDVDGWSLASELAGSTSDRPEAVWGQYHAGLQNTGSFMLREGDWKYVHYAGFAPQLFDLANDPDEIENRVGQEPEVAARLDRTLRACVDCDAVDAEAKAQNRWAFQHWREQTTEAHVRKTLCEVFEGWSDGHFEQLEAWLERGDVPVPMGGMRAYAAPQAASA